MTAEDLARQYADQKVKESPCNEYKGYSLTKQKELTRFDGYDIEQAYEDGYLQAEEDNALTWENVGRIISLDQQVCDEWGITRYTHHHKEAMEEVLRRFNEEKGNKV